MDDMVQARGLVEHFAQEFVLRAPAPKGVRYVLRSRLAQSAQGAGLVTPGVPELRVGRACAGSTCDAGCEAAVLGLPYGRQELLTGDGPATSAPCHTVSALVWRFPDNQVLGAATFPAAVGSRSIAFGPA
eukprot:3179327-Lingulodinium_polyedra.AAC.1